MQRFPPGADRFEGVDYRLADCGSPVLNDSIAHMECKVRAAPGWDRQGFLLSGRRARVLPTSLSHSPSQPFHPNAAPIHPLPPPPPQVVSRMETADHWVTYAEVTDGQVSQPDKRTAVHRRKVANYY